MKVGSLVECVNNKNHPNGIIPLELNKIYTVREILPSIPSGEPMIRLEEITNRIATTGREWGYMIMRFRELQPPIANIEEHINENTLEPELV